MRDKTLVSTLILVVFCTTYIESVDFITKCKSEDSKCAKESAQAAIPIVAAGLSQYGVETLDPVTFQRIDASTPNLKLILTDITLKGLKNCIAKKIKRDKSKSKLFLKFQCSGNLDGLYEMKGQLLILPIEGKGPIHVKLRKLEISLDIDLDDSGEHWNIKNWKHSFELKDKSDVIFENLFNGNEDLRKAMEEVLASNGNDIIYEVGPEVIKIVTKKVVDEINIFFHKILAKELSID